MKQNSAFKNSMFVFVVGNIRWGSGIHSELRKHFKNPIINRQIFFNMFRPIFRSTPSKDTIEAALRDWGTNA